MRFVPYDIVFDFFTSIFFRWRFNLAVIFYLWQAKLAQKNFKGKWRKPPTEVFHERIFGGKTSYTIPADDWGKTAGQYALYNNEFVRFISWSFFSENLTALCLPGHYVPPKLNLSTACVNELSYRTRPNFRFDSSKTSLGTCPWRLSCPSRRSRCGWAVALVPWTPAAAIFIRGFMRTRGHLCRVACRSMAIVS